MKLHKEGLKFLKNELVILIFLAYFSYRSNNDIIDALFIVMLFILIISIVFFRVPKRKFERKNGVVYAPCDGKIVVIEETEEKEFYKDQRIQVSIFMSPLNVHNQLYPINGKVIYTKYHPGKYLVAWNPKASTDNERSTVVLENKNISILLRQIAGALAKRIITYSKIGDKATVSDEFGFIKFGSRVDLFLPIGSNIQTKLNENVKGGKSIIAIY